MCVFTPSLPLDGAELAGQKLRQVDADSLGCAFDLANLGCGVTYETGAPQPYLRLTPTVQIPEQAREAMKELLFTHPDERFADMSLDADDGELVMRRTIRSGRFEDAGKELDDCLAFLDTVAYDAIVACVADALKCQKKDEGEDEGGLEAKLRQMLGR